MRLEYIATFRDALDKSFSRVAISTARNWKEALRCAEVYENLTVALVKIEVVSK